MSFTEATRNRLPASEDPVGNALSTFHSFPMTGPWGTDLQDADPPQNTAGSLRQRSDTVLSEGFPSWPGMQNTSTVRDDRTHSFLF